MRRFLFLFFASLLSLTTWAQFEYNGLWFDAGPDDLAWVCNYDDDGNVVAYEGAIVVPEVAYAAEWDASFPVVEISDKCFYENNITSISLPETITTIGDYAFAGTLIEEIVIPNSVTSAKFSHGEVCGSCTSLKKAVIGNGLKEVTDGFFQYCSALENVTIGSSVTKICSAAFYECTSLKEFTILNPTPPTIEDTGVFYNASLSTCVLYVPEEAVDAYKEAEGYWIQFASIEPIRDDSPLADGTKFEVDGIYYQVTSSSEQEVEVTYGGELWSKTSSYTGSISIPDEVTYENVTYKVIGIGEAAFYECASLSSISLPSTLQYIDQYAFAYSTSGESNSLTEIVIPESCTSIATYAFQYCTNLASVTLPSGLTEIPTSAFDRNSLTSIEIPAGVTAIGANAFRACPLTDGVTCYAVEPPVCTVQTGLSKQTPFTNVSINGLTLYVPSGSESAYREAEVWEDFGAIAAISDGGTSGQNFEYTVDPEEGTVTESFDVITLTCPSMILGVDRGGVVYGGPVNVYRDGSDEPYTTSTSVEGDTYYWMDDADTYLIITLEKAISEVGEYEVVIPAGTFYWFNNDNPVLNEEIILNYTFEGSSDTGSGVPEGYIIEPAEGEVPSLSVISLDTEGGLVESSSNFYDETKKAEFKVVNDETGATVATLGSWEIMMDEDTYHTWVEITLSNKVSEAGSYTVTIPEGVFLDATDYSYDANPAFTLSYTVTGGTGGSEYKIVVDPESGKTLESLSEFTITCEDGLALNSWDPLEVKKDGVVVAQAWGDTPIMDGVSYIGYNFVICDPSTEADLTLTDEGTYTIDVPDEYFAFDDESLSEGFTITYYIGGSEEPTGTYSYVVDPVEGQVESLSVIEFSSNDEDVDGFLGNYEYAIYSQEALVYDRSVRGEPITTATLESGGELDDYDSSIIITLKDEITEPGSYVVVIPEGSFYWVVDDEPILNEEIDLSYYIETPQGEYTFDPEDGSELTSLESFDVCHSISICCAWDQTLLITVEDENGNTVAYGADCVDNWPDSWDDPCLSCTIILNTKIVVAGMYTISIPAGYFVVGENDLLSEALTITYIVDGSEDPGTETGIGGISINDENVEGIYSTSGQKLNKAQKGVNIIRYTDGSTKKVLISK